MICLNKENFHKLKECLVKDGHFYAGEEAPKSLDLSGLVFFNNKLGQVAKIEDDNYWIAFADTVFEIMYEPVWKVKVNDFKL